MCMLCVIPPHVIPSVDKLENSALNNPHGFGFAIAVPSEQRIICERTMNPDESIRRFIQLRTQYPEGYAIWHARYATHGSQNINNCHPFVVGGDQRTYLAHNGVLDVYIPKHDDRSDTRIFAEELLPAIGGVTALDNMWVYEMMEEHTHGSKVAILTVDPAADSQIYILNDKSGWRDASGIWWSNYSCYLDYGFGMPYKSKNSYSFWDEDYGFKTPAKKTEEEPGIMECPQCLGVLDEEEVTAEYNACYYCGYCFDCEEFGVACLCYLPQTKTVTTQQGGWWNA